MRMIDRRGFLKEGAAAAAVVLGGCAGRHGRAMQDLGFTVELGRSGIRVPRVAMGTGTHGWKRESDQTRLGERALLDLFAHGVEQGAAFIDAADLYGVHRFVKEAFRQGVVKRDDVTLLSKIWFAEAPEMTPATTARPEVERFLTEMGVERIDVCLIHCVQDRDWPAALGRMRDELSELKQQGVVGAVGCSAHTHAALAVAAEDPWVDVILARINPHHKVMDEDATTTEVAATLRRARANGKGVLGMKIFGCGDLTREEQREESLRHALDGGLVDAMTIGFTERSQIDDTVGRVRSILKG